MIRQVFESGLDTPIIFASDEYEAIRIANLARQPLKRLGSSSRRIFFIHPVKHRKIDRLGVDQFHGLAASPESLNHEFSEANAHPVGTIGAVKNENSIAHSTPSAAESTQLMAGEHCPRERRGSITLHRPMYTIIGFKDMRANLRKPHQNRRGPKRGITGGPLIH